MTENAHLAHSHDPDTSKQAAAALGDTEQLKGAILDILRTYGLTGAAVFEVTARYFRDRVENDWPDVQTHSVARRMSELHMAGQTVDTGQRVMGPFRRPVARFAVKFQPTIPDAPAPEPEMLF